MYSLAIRLASSMAAWEYFGSFLVENNLNAETQEKEWIRLIHPLIGEKPPLKREGPALK